VSRGLSKQAAKQSLAKVKADHAPAAPSLAELQAQFQQAILSGDDRVLDLIPPNSRTTRDVLFGVYRNAYVARLVEVIANDHEVLKAYVGDDYFDDLARAFIASNPSLSQNARWFAEALPDFLAQREPYAFNPQLAELARIERTLALAFDAPEAEAVDLATLQAIDPDDWEHLVFTPHPSVRVLELTTNALEIWTALRADVMPPEVERIDAPQHCLIWRHDVTPMVRAMPPDERMMWFEASKGVPFGQLCQLLAVFEGPETAPLRAAGLLQGWLAAGMLSGAKISDPVPVQA